MQRAACALAARDLGAGERRSSRSTSASARCGATSSSCRCPLMVNRTLHPGLGYKFVPPLDLNRAAGAARARLRPAGGGGAPARLLLDDAAHAGWLGRPPGRRGAARRRCGGCRRRSPSARATATVEMRCLGSLPALAYLLTDRDGPSSASVRAWRLAARVVEAAVVGGGALPDLSRFSAAFPAPATRSSARASRAMPPAARRARRGRPDFVDAAMRALSAAVRDPRILRSPEAHGDSVDLSVLQPLLRAVAPDLGLAPPLVRLHDTLEPLQLRLELPPAPTPAGSCDVDAARPGDPEAGRPHLRPARPRRRRRRRAGHQGVVELGSPPRRSSSRGDASSCRRAGRGAGPRVRRAQLEFSPGALSLGGVVRYDLRRPSAGTRSARRSSMRWPPRPSRWCASAGSGAR